MHVLWALFWRDQWKPMWSNLESQAMWSWPLLAWHHRRIKRHIDRRLDQYRKEDSGSDGE